MRIKIVTTTNPDAWSATETCPAEIAKRAAEILKGWLMERVAAEYPQAELEAETAFDPGCVAYVDDETDPTGRSEADIADWITGMEAQGWEFALRDALAEVS